MCWFDSISVCAAAASPALKTWWMTGRTRPSASNGQTLLSRDCRYFTSAFAIWKLRTCPEAALRLDDRKIGSSMAAYVRPLLFGDAGEEEALDEFSRFESLMEAQIELNEFESRSADAFSYDDGIQFVREGARLEIQEINAAARRKWEMDGRKLELLHGYWFYRALDEFAQSEVAGLQIGKAENHEANQLAFISALRAKLQLREVYGVSEHPRTSARSSGDEQQRVLGKPGRLHTRQAPDLKLDLLVRGLILAWCF